ncbi:unnamed protein product [Cyprideis torosa]|uniref:Uncharacterized protein n=1 Tax=Cyprideis torosa TaxID=163714 RepID=A0A7R8W3N6_9CRUS|nr:unnamed protein product [Cyprideis torosa]CAG0883228.1 unnamed protein product [Cyprideis torosa]
MKLKISFLVFVSLWSPLLAQEDNTSSPNATEAQGNDPYCPSTNVIRPCICTVDYANVTSPRASLQCDSLLSTRALTDIMEVDFPHGFPSGKGPSLEAQSRKANRMPHHSNPQIECPSIRTHKSDAPTYEPPNRMPQHTNPQIECPTIRTHNSNSQIECPTIRTPKSKSKKCDADGSVIKNDDVNVQNLSSTRSALDTLRIENSTFARLSKESLGGKTFRKIMIARHTGRLTISEDAFAGMKDNLEELVIKNTTLASPENLFSGLKNLNRLMRLELDGNELGELPALDCPAALKTMVIADNNLQRVQRENFMNCPSLKELTITKSNIKTVGVDSFLDLVNIRQLLLNDNGFSTLRQNSFRMNAPDLEKLSLTHNDLFQLEDGFFKGDISGAAIVELHDNNLTTLHRDAIEPLLQELRTGYMTAYSNPIVCGCELAWLIRDNGLRERVQKGDGDVDSGIRCHRGAYDHWVDGTRWLGQALSTIQGSLVRLAWIRDNPLVWPLVEGLTGRYFSHLRAADFDDCP